MAGHDAARMLTVLDGVVDEGHDLVHFWSELIAAVRDLLLLDTLPERKELLSRSPDEAAALARAAVGLSREDLSRIFQIVADLEPGLKSSSQPQFLFEATLIRLSALAAVRPIEEILGSISGEGARPSPDPGRTSPPAGKPPARQKKKHLDAADLLTRLHGTRPMLAAVLEQASSVKLDGGVLRVRFEAGMEALKRTLEQADSLELLRKEAAPDGGRLEVRAEIAPGEPTRTEAPAAVRPTPKTPVAPRKQPPPPVEGREVSGSLLDRIRAEPAVGKLLDAFGAQVVDVRPLDPSPEGGGDGVPPAAPKEER